MLSRQSTHTLPALRTGRALLPRNIYFFYLWYSFLLEAEKPLGPVRSEGLGKLKQFIHLIRSRTHDLPACSIVT
jgi:hypothetical protein